MGGSMHQSRRIRIGKFASVCLAVFAAFYGAYAFGLLVLMLVALVSGIVAGELNGWPELGLPLLMVFSLLVAVTPFVATRFYYSLDDEAKPPQRLATQVGVVMAFVAIIWGVVWAQVTYESIVIDEPYALIATQGLMVGLPALLAAFSAWGAFGARAGLEV